MFKVPVNRFCPLPSPLSSPLPPQFPLFSPGLDSVMERLEKLTHSFPVIVDNQCKPKDGVNRNPCKNSGKCEFTNGEVKCVCPVPYEGPTCSGKPPGHGRMACYKQPTQHSTAGTPSTEKSHTIDNYCQTSIKRSPSGNSPLTA